MRTLAAIALVAPALLVALSISCAFRLPTRPCSGATMVAPFAGEVDPSPACLTCVESECCDDVGHCADETASGCSEKVELTHGCVVEAGQRGALEENACRRHLEGGTRPTSVYNCMRDSCGEACRLPTCKLSPAVREFVSPSCDRCVSGSCCSEINACYGDRTCQLTLECITRTCAADLKGDIDNAVARGLANETDVDKLPACSVPLSRDGPACSEGFGVGCCIQRCIREYQSDSVDPGLDTTKQPSCLAFKVFACSARARCGVECGLSVDASAADARDD